MYKAQDFLRNSPLASDCQQRQVTERKINMRKTALVIAAIFWTAPIARADDVPAAAPATVPVQAAVTAPAATKPRLLAVRSRGGAGDKQDRTVEVKNLVDAYQKQCVRYVDSLVIGARAQADAKPEAGGAVVVATPRPDSFVLMLGRLVADNPQDTAAFEALTFLTKYVGVPSIEEILSNVPGKTADEAATKVDPLALLLQHHANDARLAEVCERLPASPATDKFLAELFAQTKSPEVRGRVGFRLVGLALKNNDQATAEELLAALAEDRYMAAVRVNVRGHSAQKWADGKLRELRLLGIGQPLPEVAGETPDGKKASITEYRGKVVVVDVWTTWCSPCRAMIPHEREMVKRLEGEPFALLSVSCDEEKQTLTDFLNDTAMPWDHWWVGMESDFAKTLNISSFPTVFVLDAKGIVRFKNLRGEKLEEAVRSLLAEER